MWSQLSTGASRHSNRRHSSTMVGGLGFTTAQVTCWEPWAGTRWRSKTLQTKSLNFSIKMTSSAATVHFICWCNMHHQQKHSYITCNLHTAEGELCLMLVRFFPDWWPDHPESGVRGVRVRTQWSFPVSEVRRCSGIGLPVPCRDPWKPCFWQHDCTGARGPASVLLLPEQVHSCKAHHFTWFRFSLFGSKVR